MTNFEKYAQAFNTTEFGLFGDKPVLCDDINCGNCQWHNSSGDKCSVSQMKWLKSEYVDWEEKINQAKSNLMEVLNWSILCDTFSFCEECPLYFIKEKMTAKMTCNNVLGTLFNVGMKGMLEDE